jgi:hypothetical protein
VRKHTGQDGAAEALAHGEGADVAQREVKGAEAAQLGQCRVGGDPALSPRQ